MEQRAANKAGDCVAFWVEAGWDKWFTKDPSFDSEFRQKFLDLHFEAARREHDAWLDTPEGALALMILLDQFPRNCFRGTAHMFATDPLARMYAHQALAKGHDKHFDGMLPAFFYLPFEHSEDIEDQKLSVRLFAPMGEEMLKYADVHHEVIERFGRFPHRNPQLGRTSTPDELKFLADGGFAG
jgi:uncharacterized protein (DUF924 family)